MCCVLTFVEQKITVLLHSQTCFILSWIISYFKVHSIYQENIFLNSSKAILDKACACGSLKCKNSAPNFIVQRQCTLAMKKSSQLVKFMNEAIIIVQFLMGISYYIELNTRVWGWEQMKESGFKETLGHLSALVKFLTGFSSGHDLTVWEFEPRVELCVDGAEPAWDSLPLSAPPCLCSLSRNKYINLKNKIKKYKTSETLFLATKFWTTGREGKKEKEKRKKGKQKNISSQDGPNKGKQIGKRGGGGKKTDGKELRNYN